MLRGGSVKSPLHARPDAGVSWVRSIVVQVGNFQEIKLWLPTILTGLVFFGRSLVVQIFN